MPLSTGNDLLTMRASDLIDLLRAKSLMLTCAESCTGGMLSSLVTDIPGSSDVFDRGFVTYSNDAKMEMLGVPAGLIDRFGAVSREVATAMAEGAIAHSKAQISIAITGIAGPGGGTTEKPVGLVHFGACRIEPDSPDRRSACDPIHVERRFGDIARDQVRLAAVGAGLDILNDLIAGS